MLGRVRALVRGYRFIASSLLTLSTLARATWAQSTQPEPFRLSFGTSAGCGEADAFLAQLRARTLRVRAARGNEPGITFVVETFRTPSGVRGQLIMHRPGARPIVREVPGASCDEVISAMALIAALMVDPLAGSAPPRPTWPPKGEESRPAARREPAFAGQIEHRLSARTAVAPKLALGQTLAVALISEASSLRPSLGLSLSTARGTRTVTNGSAEFDWVAGRLALCPVGLGSARLWDLRFCAGVELGRLRGTGYATAAPASKSILWSSAAALLDAQRRLLGPLWLGGEAGLTFPWTREHFYLDPQTNLHRIPAWGVTGAIGLAFHFF